MVRLGSEKYRITVTALTWPGFEPHNLPKQKTDIQLLTHLVNLLFLYEKLMLWLPSVFIKSTTELKY